MQPAVLLAVPFAKPLALALTCRRTLNRKQTVLQLRIIIASTRPGRKGPAVAQWITQLAQADSRFNTEVLDLAQINLPLFNEPNHPRLQQYEHQHTKDWSAAIAAADAYIVVTPEYNFSFPATIKNALDYLFVEWQHKPMAFVSYGGQSGGLRSVQMLKQVVTTLNMMPITESVAINFFNQKIDEAGHFNADEMLNKSAAGMLNAVHRWGTALKTMRSA